LSGPAKERTHEVEKAGTLRDAARSTERHSCDVQGKSGGGGEITVERRKEGGGAKSVEDPSRLQKKKISLSHQQKGKKKIYSGRKKLASCSATTAAKRVMQVNIKKDCRLHGKGFLLGGGRGERKEVVPRTKLRESLVSREEHALSETRRSISRS